MLMFRHKQTFLQILRVYMVHAHEIKKIMEKRKKREKRNKNQWILQVLVEQESQSTLILSMLRLLCYTNTYMCFASNSNNNK